MDTTIKALQEMQAHTNAMRLTLAHLVTTRALTTEQIVQAHTRLENFCEDVDSMLSELEDK